MNNIEGNHHSCVSLVIGHLKACCPCDQLNSFTGWEAVSVWSRLCDDGSVSRALWPGRWSQVDASFPSVFSATLAWYQLVGTMLGQCSHEIWTQLHSLLTCQPLLNSQGDTVSQVTTLHCFTRHNNDALIDSRKRRTITIFLGCYTKSETVFK